jgi:hypothetical protein
LGISSWFLVLGHWSLVIGHWSLVPGIGIDIDIVCWFLVIGHWFLVLAIVDNALHISNKILSLHLYYLISIFAGIILPAKLLSRTWKDFLI